jgi:methionyl-tRNA formyltransferase
VPLRIVFCGTPAFALPTLNHLLAQPDFQVEAAVTQPDRPRGRRHEVSNSPVKDAALDAGIAVYQPEKIKSESAQNFFKRVAPDAVVIIAYGQIISQALLDIPRLGWINLHGSLLPKYRGAAPINWALVNGETRTGVTTMQVNAGLDTGPILLKYETEIAPDETAPQLAARLAEAGAPLIAETLRKLDRGEVTPAPQDDSRASLAPLLKREDGRIDWSQPAQTIYNRIRGLQPWPGAFTAFRGKNCHIWGKPSPDAIHARPPAPRGAIIASDGKLTVACGGNTALRVEFVQLEGRKRVTAREFASGARIAPSDHFGA